MEFFQRDEFKDLQEIRRSGATPLEFWTFVLSARRYQRFWSEYQLEGKVEIEMWKFLTGVKRKSVVEKWQEEHSIADPTQVFWMDVVREIPWIRIKAVRVLDKMGPVGVAYLQFLSILESNNSHSSFLMKTITKEHLEAESVNVQFPIILSLWVRLLSEERGSVAVEAMENLVVLLKKRKDYVRFVFGKMKEKQDSISNQKVQRLLKKEIRKMERWL